MKLTLELPIGCDAERRWVADTLLGTFLGLSFQIRITDGQEVRLTDGQTHIRLPDIFFADIRENWGRRNAYRIQPGLLWSVEQLPADVNTVTERVPMIFGDGEFSWSENDIRLPIDIFGSAFFLLSRYEEFVDPRRDRHDRYCARFSKVGTRALLERPLVNEYLEVLWSCIAHCWPGLERTARNGGIYVSADVDVPYSPGNRNIPRLIRRIGGDLIRRRSLTAPVRSVASYGLSKFGYYGADPYFRWLDWLMTVNERAGNQVQFYFISDRPAGTIDGSYDLHEPIIQQLMSDILSRGHHIGLHPSYTTYQNLEQMVRERSRLEEAVRKIAPDYNALKVRQHFLRWSVSETAHHHESSGFLADSTLGYADAPGFRTGVCYPYQMYDLHRRQPLKIWQEPLVAMEVSVFGKEYLNVENHDAALDILLKLKQNCLRFGGDFRLLWHNNHLVTEADRAVYEQLI